MSHDAAVMEERIRQVPKKRTLMKPRIGCVRQTTYNLPDANNVYGYTLQKDAEGAGELISNWVTTNPSSGKESSTSHVHTNILAIKHGCITAKSMRKYTEEHPNIRMKEALQSSSARPDSLIEGPFGIKTELRDAHEFGEIIQTKFTNYSTEDADYPVLKGFVMHGYMPKPRPTRSSELLDTFKKSQSEASLEKKNFCMKRFQNISSNFEKVREQQRSQNQFS
jgi:hypothetical protein